MDYQEEEIISAAERKQRRIERRKKELRNARIKFAVACGVIILALILIIVSCSKGCSKKEEPEPTQVVTESVTEAPTETERVFSYSASNSELILVNAENPIDETFLVELASLQSGAKVSRLCMDDLQKMFDDCRAAGNDPYVISAYVSYADQQKEFDKRVSDLTAIGYKEEDAQKEVVKSYARPGTTEYQTGLLLDIVTKSVKNKDAEKLADNATLQWLRENSWKYGFVERYTEAQAERKNMTYEPWCYRYVGKDAAKDMVEMDLCLEDLLVLLDVPE